MQQPLGVVSDEVSFITMHQLSPLLILIIVFGLVALATLSIYLRRFRLPIKGAVEIEPNLLIPGPTHEVSSTDNNEQGLAEVLVKMRELLELSQRLQAAAQTIVRSNIAPLLKMENVDSSSQTRRYLPFFLGDELFAVSINAVEEVVEANRLIIESDTLCRTRRAINLRGSVVRVIDLSTHFGGEPTEVNHSTLIVILVLSHDVQPQMIGIKVDAICAILNIAPSSIEPPLIQQADIRSGFTMGTLKTDNRSITLLDISRGLSMGRLPEPNSASRMLE